MRTSNMDGYLYNMSKTVGSKLPRLINAMTPDSALRSCIAPVCHAPCIRIWRARHWTQ
jgi:hypothetical protein